MDAQADRTAHASEQRGEAPIDAAGGRVAVIAVHGVADQREGDTAQALVDLLVALRPQGSVYEAREGERFTIQVPPLPPHGAMPPHAVAPVPRSGLRKAFHQSLFSDLHRPGDLAAIPARAPAGAAAPGAPRDRGLEVTNYLLEKSLRYGASAETYRSTCIRLTRRADAGTEHVDVYEAYWADLSRLSGKLPRIVTELFAFVFRLSKLGRETVQEAATHFGAEASRAWPTLAFLQRWLDWLFVNGVALLFAQLGLLAAFIALIGGSRTDADTVRWVGGALLLAVGVLWWLYERQDGARGRRGVAALVALAGLVLLVAGRYQALVLGLLVLAGITLLFDIALRASEERFPFVRPVGIALWVATLVVTGLRAWRSGGDWADADLSLWLGPALFGTEVVLWGIKGWWIAAPALLTLWLAAGLWAQRSGGYEAAGSVGTGRLGVLVSFATFLTLTMGVWALIEGVLQAAVKGVTYEPAIFIDAPLMAADVFLKLRYEASTAFFAPVASLLLLIIFYLAAMLVPSILAELGLTSRPAAGKRRHARRPRTPAAVRRLGRWLTAGYRRLDAATTTVAVLSAAAAWIVAMVLLDARSMPAILSDEGGFGLWARLSRRALEPLVFSAAGVAAALTLLGGVLSRYLPSLRAPLDIALDVDNYFREFPRRHIARARMFSRFHALLGHVAAQRYDRIVIVAHSQGTVIGAELLRWMASAPDAAVAATRTERLKRRLGADVRLLTLGCPLRQLYAARFPTLYGWLLEARGGANGPTADDLGVQVWANAYTSGDYVGRWLWSSPAAGGGAIGRPMTDSVHPPQFGRSDAYAPFQPMPPDAHPLASARELEVCVGAGAHTHYFELDQSVVAWLIEQLVAAPRP